MIRRAFALLAFARATSGQPRESCVPLCSYDDLRTASCTVSREHVLDLVSLVDRGVWAEILRADGACQASCGSGCETDQLTGLCNVDRGWLTRRLALPVDEGGAGFGDRCGLFGRLLIEGMHCGNETTDQERCAERAAATSGVSCAWDDARKVCDVSKEGVLFLLRRDFRDELVRAGLRRQRCEAVPSEGLCSGDCAWAGGLCTIRDRDALLAVSGEDCPLETILRSHEGCAVEANASVCLERRRTDGNAECIWRQGRCEAHPMSLELDLLGILGLAHPYVAESFAQAQNTCTALVPSLCNVLCADEIELPQASASARAVPPPPRGALAAAALAVASFAGAASAGAGASLG